LWCCVGDSSVPSALDFPSSPLSICVIYLPLPQRDIFLRILRIFFGTVFFPTDPSTGSHSNDRDICGLSALTNHQVSLVFPTYPFSQDKSPVIAILLLLNGVHIRNGWWLPRKVTHNIPHIFHFYVTLPSSLPKRALS
jgi:hypothetical protein